MFLDKEDLYGIAGGVAFAVGWLFLSGFESFLQPIAGGLFFIVTWFVARRISEK